VCGLYVMVCCAAWGLVPMVTQSGLCVAYAALEQQVPAPEPEVVREMTPPLESEAPVEEVHDLSEAPPAEIEDDVGPSPVESTATPVIEEPESPMVQHSPAATVHEPEAEPKKFSYAAIVSDGGLIWSLVVCDLEGCDWNVVVRFMMWC
jgi:hypothetical protein